MWVNKEQYSTLQDRVVALEVQDSRRPSALGHIVHRLDKLEHEQNTMGVPVVDEDGEFIEDPTLGRPSRYRCTEVGMDTVIRKIADHLQLKLEVTPAMAPELRVWDSKPVKRK